MTDYQLTVDRDTLQQLFVGKDQLAHLVETVLNQVLQAQVTEHLQAAPYERTDERRGYRNGYQPHHLTTRVGTLTLRIPQVREGQFSTELFARYQRELSSFGSDVDGDGRQWGLNPQGDPHH